MKNTLRILLTVLLLTNVLRAQAPKREFRAVWITTLANLDWPSKKGLSSDLQKKEFTDLLDQMQEIGFNAVFVQIRPSGDAFYPSEIALWSHYLTGIQGKSPLYDPVAFMVEECHKRNMEFHAWFNPVRAISNVKFSPVSYNHITHNRPEWFFDYGDARYFNPGFPAVREYISEIVLEVVRNYDIDGVHFDDYFYPYPIPGKPIPDWGTFREYGDGFNSVADWRRWNIDKMIEMVSKGIKSAKPWVKFGVSPFGVWRNKEMDIRGSDTFRACASYDDLYADSRKWYMGGWLDYIAPQLYWSTRNHRANYRELLDWWGEIDSDRHLYVGHGLSRMKENPKPRNLTSAEFVLQVGLCRQNGKSCGDVFFRASTLKENVDGVTTLLKDRLFNLPALVPPMKWLDSIPPDRPLNMECVFSEGGVMINWEAPKAETKLDEADYYVVYRFPEETEVMNLDDPNNIRAIVRDRTFWDSKVEPGKSYTYCVTSVDRLHNESLRFAHKRIKCEQSAP